MDESSNKPGEQAFEVSDIHRRSARTFTDHYHQNVYQKLISGRYLGEILRLVICELIDEGVLFLGQNTYKLEVPYSFDTAFLSLMERCVMSISARSLTPDNEPESLDTSATRQMSFS